MPLNYYGKVSNVQEDPKVPRPNGACGEREALFSLLGYLRTGYCYSYLKAALVTTLHAIHSYPLLPNSCIPVSLTTERSDLVQPKLIAGSLAPVALHFL